MEIKDYIEIFQSIEYDFAIRPNLDYWNMLRKSEFRRSRFCFFATVT